MANAVAPEGIGARLYRRLSAVPVLFLLIVGVWSQPTVALLVDSLRGRSDQLNRGFWTVAADPEQLTLDNYDTVLNRGGPYGMTDSLISSFTIVIPATIIPIFFAALAAYAFAFIDFKGREWIFIGTVSLMAVPIQVTLIPLLTTYVNGAHLTIPLTHRTITAFPDLNVNTHGTMAVWLTQTSFALPFAIFLLHSAFTRLPQELIDSARIDGANHATIFRRLVLPLSIPALTSLATLQFLWSWNDFLVPQIMTSGGDPINLPSAVVLANIVGDVNSAGPTGAAAMFVQAAVPLLVFFAMQRHIVQGLLAGSVNG